MVVSSIEKRTFKLINCRYPYVTLILIGVVQENDQYRNLSTVETIAYSRNHAFKDTLKVGIVKILCIWFSTSLL